MGYFRGLLPRIARKGFGSIVAWSFYEYLIDKKDAMIFSWTMVLVGMEWLWRLKQMIHSVYFDQGLDLIVRDDENLNWTNWLDWDKK
jgi:hypothetical protein